LIPEMRRLSSTTSDDDLAKAECACSELRQTTYPKQRDTPARPGWIGTLTVSAVPNRPRLPASMQAPQLSQTDESPALTLAPHLALAAVDGVAGPVVLSLQLAQSPLSSALLSPLDKGALCELLHTR
jgi:hypothetical protein